MWERRPRSIGVAHRKNVDEDGLHYGAIVGILSQADYASALELRRGIGTVGERDQSMLMTGTGDVSASGR